jgi:hypothetical protein
MSPNPSPVLASPDPAPDQPRTEPRERGLSKLNAVGLPHTEESLALRLSDAQLDKIMRLCQPLDPHCRDALLRILAHELRGRRDIGDGELHRLARTIIKDKRLFDPPDIDTGRMLLPPPTLANAAIACVSDRTRRSLSPIPDPSDLRFSPTLCVSSHR